MWLFSVIRSSNTRLESTRPSSKCTSGECRTPTSSAYAPADIARRPAPAVPADRRRNRGCRGPAAGRPGPRNHRRGPRPHGRPRAADHGPGGRRFRPSGRANLHLSSGRGGVGRGGADVLRGRVPRRLPGPRPVRRRPVGGAAGAAAFGVPAADGRRPAPPRRRPPTAAEPTTRRTAPRRGPRPCGKGWCWGAISPWNPPWPAAA